MPTANPEGQFEVVAISSLDDLSDPMRTSTITTYQRAFAREPYCEDFSTQEVEEALTTILDKNGDIVIGKLGNDAVSLAGGYQKPDGTYYVEELAVEPTQQGKGYGRLTLSALLSSTGAPRYEIRTTTANRGAIALYQSLGFAPETRTEVAAQQRQSGEIEIDERLYLSKPPMPEQEMLRGLKRAAIAYPSGNTTAVIFDQLLRQDRTELNAQIMRSWKVREPAQTEIEQCCFVTLPTNPESIARVEMFGGEFCGNATRSAIWLLTKGKDYEGLIEVSGVDRSLAFSVTNGDVSVEMPLPTTGSLAQSVAEGTLVQLDGITQLVVTNPEGNTTPRQQLTGLLQDNKYSLATQPAVGVSFYDELSGKAEFCVWVNEVDTIFDETACGSGTCAIGVATAIKTNQPVDFSVVQPSGESIRTIATYSNGTVTKSVISGEVSVLYDGELELS